MLKKLTAQSMTIACFAAIVMLMPQSLVSAKSFAQPHVVPSLVCSDVMLVEVKAPTSQIDFRSQIWRKTSPVNGRCQFLGSIYGRSVFYHTTGAIQETVWDVLFVDNAQPGTSSPHQSYNSTQGQAVASNTCSTGQHLESDAYGSGFYNEAVALVASATCPAVYGG